MHLFEARPQPGVETFSGSRVFQPDTEKCVENHEAESSDPCRGAHSFLFGVGAAFVAAFVFVPVSAFTRFHALYGRLHVLTFTRIGNTFTCFGTLFSHLHVLVSHVFGNG